MIGIEGDGARRLQCRMERRQLDIDEVNARTLVFREEECAGAGIGGIGGASRTVAGTAGGDGEREEPRS